MKKHRSLNVLSGPLLFLLVLLILAPVIEFKQAAAIATIFWMGLWWDEGDPGRVHIMYG